MDRLLLVHQVHAAVGGQPGVAHTDGAAVVFRVVHHEPVGKRRGRDVGSPGIVQLAIGQPHFSRPYSSFFAGSIRFQEVIGGLGDVVHLAVVEDHVGVRH